MNPPLDHIVHLNRSLDDNIDRRKFIRLDRNEWVEPPQNTDFEQFKKELKPEDFSAYPNPSQLYKNLSQQTKLDQNFFMATNGSDAAIRAIFLCYIERGDSIAQLSPSYAMYEVYANLFRAKTLKVDFENGPSLPFEKLIHLIEQKPKVLFLANPNQPTGTILNKDQELQVVELTQENNVILVADEAYYPFHNRSFIKYIQEGWKHVIVVRSFSKAFGLAGLRLGYTIADPVISKSLLKTQGLHEVNAVAIRIGSYLLQNNAVIVEFMNCIRKGNQYLKTKLESRRFQMPQTYCNFQLLKVPETFDPREISAFLKSEGYLIRLFDHPCLSNFMRITLAGEPIMKGFAETLLRYPSINNQK
jgi:histidinol-phosphate aminotransferase